MRSLSTRNLVAPLGLLASLWCASCGHAPGPTAAPESTFRAPPVTPTNQVLTPAGTQVALPGMRPQMIALSPNGAVLAVAGNGTELVIVDPGTGAIRQKLAIPPGSVRGAASEASNLTATTADRASVAGLVFSPDGTRLYCSNANGTVKVFAVDEGGIVTAKGEFPLPGADAPRRKAETPAGLAVSSNGTRLYVVGNLGNQLLELDASDGRLVRRWAVGFAPLEVVLAGGKAYVSNQGGARPDATANTGPGGRGTLVHVDARSIADQGSVSVIDLASGRVDDITVGAHASALAASPDGRHVVVANAGSDTLNAIDTRTDRVVEKIWTRETPADPFGAQPCALAFDPTGERLYVCNSTQNAVAVIEFEPGRNASKVVGLIPVAWFPAGVIHDRGRGQLVVSNLRGLGQQPRVDAEPAKFRTAEHYGTLSLIPVPGRADLERYTRTARLNFRQPQLEAAKLPARPGQPARPVPERAGEPSVFRHVIYIVKENRCYDQVLGDMKEGNGDASLCTFGEAITPNQHAIAREFVLLDNTYCAGVQSADGHQWITSGFANDYIERQLTAGYPRSYPGGKGDPDALAYASSGFIWDNALAHGRTFRNYGEWMVSECGWADRSRKGKPAWADYWKDRRDGTQLTRIQSRPSIETLGRHSAADTVGWDGTVPDAIRADRFIADLKRFEEEGRMPEFILLFLPNDHTANTRPGAPTPAAYIADNDLALGRIVEAVSHSRFWRDTCIFAIEDDPQAGWDHVSGYRTTCYVASPYTRRGAVVSRHYNQPGLLRTMELILGLPPMNLLDATATPLTECFTAQPDYTPFVARPARVPLEELNPDLKKITDARQRRDALASQRMRLDQPDLINEAEFNRILWHAMKGQDTPFPAWAVKLDDD